MIKRHVALVCGGRYYANRDKVFEVLGRMHAEQPITYLIEGGARGADSLAREWREQEGVPGYTYNAQWNNHGRAAGAIRNKLMLDHGKPDVCVAFPGGSGTVDMMCQARKAGVPVIEPAKGETHDD